MRYTLREVSLVSDFKYIDTKNGRDVIVKERLDPYFKALKRVKDLDGVFYFKDLSEMVFTLKNMLNTHPDLSYKVYTTEYGWTLFKGYDGEVSYNDLDDVILESGLSGYYLSLREGGLK
jgi:hypothetical protein